MSAFLFHWNSTLTECLHCQRVGQSGNRKLTAGAITKTREVEQEVLDILDGQAEDQ
jgi:hypothetical protein